jgi:hypothetical protein
VQSEERDRAVIDEACVRPETLLPGRSRSHMDLLLLLLAMMLCVAPIVYECYGAMQMYELLIRRVSWASVICTCVVSMCSDGGGWSFGPSNKTYLLSIPKCTRLLSPNTCLIVSLLEMVCLKELVSLGYRRYVLFALNNIRSFERRIHGLTQLTY